MQTIVILEEYKVITERLELINDLAMDVLDSSKGHSDGSSNPTFEIEFNSTSHDMFITHGGKGRATGT